MTTDDRVDPVLVPRKGALILLLPMLAVPLVFIAWGVFLYIGVHGRAADGNAVVFTLLACPEARPVLEKRAKEMGIEAELSEVPGGFLFKTRLPLEPESAAQVVPGLTIPGSIEVRTPEGGHVLGNEGVTDASVRLDLLLTSCTLLRLTPTASQAVEVYAHAHPEGEVRFWLDGVDVGRSVNREMTIGELELWPAEGSDLEKMHLAATRGVTIDNPLPCVVTVGSSQMGAR